MSFIFQCCGHRVHLNASLFAHPAGVKHHLLSNHNNTDTGDVACACSPTGALKPNLKCTRGKEVDDQPYIGKVGTLYNS
jgi:hypothetical protein